MTEAMKQYLTRASNPKGACIGGFKSHKEAYFQKKWVTLWGYAQNSTNPRFVITEKGAQALREAQ